LKYSVKTTATKQLAAAWEIPIQKLQELDPEGNRDSVVKRINDIRRPYRKKYKNAVSYKKLDTSTDDANKIRSLLINTLPVVGYLLHLPSRELRYEEN
jgi:hypothetical protein